MILSHSSPAELPSGRLHLSLSQCLALRLRHVVSGLDEDASHFDHCGAATTLCGYTEWVSPGSPCVTIGWDWRLESRGGAPHYVRVGEPFSNVVLVDIDGLDYDFARSQNLLGWFIDGLPWCVSTSEALSMRYG